MKCLQTGDPPHYIFQDAKEEAIEFMVEDSFPEFLKSEIYLYMNASELKL